MKDVQHVGEKKLNCFWHCYQSFRICLYVRIILMKLYCDAMKVSTLVPAGKKGFNLGFMCLASRLSRYNIPSNTNETTMVANASQWFADQRQYHVTTEYKVVRMCTNKEKYIIDRCCSRHGSISWA